MYHSRVNLDGIKFWDYLQYFCCIHQNERENFKKENKYANWHYSFYISLNHKYNKYYKIPFKWPFISEFEKEEKDF